MWWCSRVWIVSASVLAGQKKRRYSRHPSSLWGRKVTVVQTLAWIVKILKRLRVCSVVKGCPWWEQHTNMKLILQKIKCDVICSSARLSLKKCTCMFSLNAKTTQLHCVFMHNICKRKQHLLYETHNLHYLLIYTGSGCFDVLLLTSDTVFYRNEKKKRVSPWIEVIQYKVQGKAEVRSYSPLCFAVGIVFGKEGSWEGKGRNHHTSVNLLFIC